MIAIEPEPDPLRRLAALIAVDGPGAEAIAKRLRLPNAWRDRLRDLAPPWPFDPNADLPAQRRALYRLGAVRFRDLALLAAAEGLVGPERLTELLRLARDWTVPNFPLTGHDVRALGIPPGPSVGALLDAVERWWEAADFVPDRSQCLNRLKQVLTCESAGAAIWTSPVDNGRPRTKS
jgi:poly(A) polymerase